MKRSLICLLFTGALAIGAFLILGNRQPQKPIVPFSPENADNLLAVSEIWKGVGVLYCNFELLPQDFDWDAEYKTAFARIAQVTDEYQYYLELSRFMATLQDGHVQVLPANPNLLGSLPFQLQYIQADSCYYVIATGDSTVPLYSRLEAINGTPALQYLEESIAPYVGIHTPLAREESIAAFFLYRGKRGDNLTLTFLTPEGKTVTGTHTYGTPKFTDWAPVFNVQRDGLLYQDGVLSLRKADPLKSTEENILILQVRTLAKDFRKEYVNSVLPYIEQSQGCIIDIRRGGGGNSLNGEVLLYPFVEDSVIENSRSIRSVTQIKNTADMVAAQFLEEQEALIALGSTTKEDFEKIRPYFPEESARRGRLMLENRYTTATEDELAALVDAFNHRAEAVGLNWLADIPKSQVPVAVLVYHTSGSAVDNTAATAREWGIPLIGTHTKGATGNVMILPLANGWQATFSSERVLAPDGTDIWNHGVVADLQADYTIEDLKQGIDTPLQTALHYLERQN